MRKFSLKKKIVSAALAAIMAISVIPALPSSMKEVQATGDTYLSKSIIGEENVLTGTSGNLPDTESKYFHRIFTENKEVLTNADIMVFETDAKCTKSTSDSRIGFTFVRKTNGNLFVQKDTVWYGNDGTLTKLENIEVKDNWEKDANWHLKVIVKPTVSVQMLITDNDNNGSVVCDVTVEWSKFGNLSTPYAPHFFVNTGGTTACELTNIAVRYDITAEVAALESAIATAETEAGKLTNPSATVTETIASANALLEVAKAGNSTKNDVTSMKTTLDELEYEEAEPPSYYSKSIVGEENVLTGTSGNLPDADNKFFHRIFTENKEVLTNADIMVFETDAKCTKSTSDSRIGFTFVRKGDGSLYVARNVVYTGKLNGNSVTNKKQGEIEGTSCWEQGTEWHLKVIVKPAVSVQMIITNKADNALVYTITVDWAEFGDVSTPYAPHFFISSGGNTACELTNITVRYDITSEVAALESAIATADTRAAELTNPSATVTSTIASAKTTLETAKAGNALKTDVTSAITALSSLVYENASASLTVGDGTTVSTVSISIAVGETLPTGWNEDKYIIDWTYNGEKVTTYAADTDVSKYVPNFIDKKMLVVKTQTKAGENNTVTARFIGSLDNYQDADYDYVGFVLSTTTADPLQATNHLDKDIHVVWDAIYASGELKTAASIYDSYSHYLFALDVDGLTAGKTVYARAYIKLTNGEIVYGDPCTIGIQD